MARQVIDELDEPQTIWSTVSRFAGLGCLMLMIAIISVPFFPRFADYRKLNEEGREVAARRDKLKGQLDEKEAELRMIETDPQFLELKARDHLDLSKEGEVVFRFEK
jgi:cell division protein FtsB